MVILALIRSQAKTLEAGYLFNLSFIDTSTNEKLDIIEGFPDLITDQVFSILAQCKRDASF